MRTTTLGAIRWSTAVAAMLAIAPSLAAAQDAGGAILLKDATIITVDGPVIPKGSVLVRDGKIAAVGTDVAAPPGTTTWSLAGKFVMPGVIDTHSHMGVYSWPHVKAHSDGNEATAPITAEVRAADSVNVEDPAFAKARAGGVTTIQILPGSANLIGGQSVVLKLREAKSVDAMLFQAAPRGLKMALGENPKRVYGGRDKTPSTRMGNAAVLRQTYHQAAEYRRKWERHDRKVEIHQAKLAAGEATDADAPEPPERNLQLETLAAVLKGEIRLNVHCYESHDIEFLLRLVDEFQLTNVTIHHALETYKVADELAKRGIMATTWVDWWGFKVEAYDGIPYGLGILLQKGVLASIHSDDSAEVQWLWHNAAKATRYGVSEADAFKCITLNPARQLGIGDRVGSVTAGKDADLVVFDKHPFDMYTKVELTLVDGKVVYRRTK